MPLLGHVDLNTGLPVRKPKPLRYEHANPGDLVHLEVKKLGPIPDGGGWRTSETPEERTKKSVPTGYSCLHSALDDHSRVVNSEILKDEKKETTAGFWNRAHASYKSLGITMTRALTDNGPPRFRAIISYQYLPPTT